MPKLVPPFLVVFVALAARPAQADESEPTETAEVEGERAAEGSDARTAVAEGQPPDDEAMRWGLTARRLAPRGPGMVQPGYGYQRTRNAHVDGGRIPNLDTHSASLRLGVPLAFGRRAFLSLPVGYEGRVAPEYCEGDGSDCSVHRVSTGLSLAVFVSPRVTLFGMGMAALSGRRGEMLRRRAVQPVVALGFNWLASDQVAFGMALSYSNGLGRRLVVPSITLVYAPNDSLFRLEMVLPQQVRVFLDAHERFAISAAVVLGGGAYFLGTVPVGVRNTSLQELSVGTALRFDIQLGAGVSLHPEIGITWYRQGKIDSDGLDTPVVYSDLAEPTVNITLGWRPVR